MNLILLGPPGSGKGTQAKLLAKKLNLNHISSGALLRQKAAQNDPKGKLIKDIMNTGELVPFDTVLEVILDEIKASPHGFILDGTPRDIAQAEHMDWYFKENDITVDHVLYYDLPEEEALNRLAHRAQQEGRSDDTPATHKTRLEVYHQQTEPVIAHYQKLHLVITIDARPNIDTILAATLQKLQK